tara:strand:+ start:69 stop:743 length:675 start_codon:yes stop_codon:yes gene_type:complete
MKNINVAHPPNIGWLEIELDKTEMDYLWKCIDNKGECNKKNLAGVNEGAYTLKDKDNWFLYNVIGKCIDAYQKGFGENRGQYVPNTVQHPIVLHHWWVNYMKQHDYNPCHLHKGLYSFVVWMKIPTEYKDQKQLPHAVTSRSESVSNFEFLYNNILGETKQCAYHMNKEREGQMLFFPSELHHQVYPFYNCDEERISISGNIRIASDISINDSRVVNTKSKGFK